MHDLWNANKLQLDDKTAMENRINTLEAVVSELRESNEAWRGAALRYRHIIDHVNDGIYELDRDGKFTFVNAVIVERSGIDEKAFPSLDFCDILIPEDRERARAALMRILAGRPGQPIEVRCRAKDGSTIPVELNQTPVYTKGRITGVRGVTRNVTERKRMEAQILRLNEDLERRIQERTTELAAEIEERKRIETALAESEETFRNFMKNSPIALCVTDLSGRVQFVNKKIEDASGWSMDELIGRNALEIGLFDEETKQVLLDRLSARLEGDKPRVTEISLTARDGSLYWVDIKTAILEKDGKPSALQLGFINITERKRAEAALRESEARYRQLVNFLPLALFEIDREGKILSGNAAIYETFGYVPDDLEHGLNALEMIIPEDRNRVIKDMLRVFAGEMTGGTEYTAIRKGGERFPIVVFSNPIMQDGRSVGLRGAIIDMTRLKNAEQELQQAQELLQRTDKLASIGRLSAGVAHEILNPINIISMELQLMQHMEELPEAVRNEIHVCGEQIRRIVNIAENLKQCSRIPAKKLSKNALSHTVDRVLSLYGPQFKLEEVQMDVRHELEMPDFLFDREMIEQVILNLISNAVYAMEDVNEKVLRIETCWDKGESGGNARVMIADNGGGIRDEDLPKVFEPFFTTKDCGEGTGLGLSISYGIIHDHGGIIWAENNEWGGASFFFEIPVNLHGEE